MYGFISAPAAITCHYGTEPEAISKTMSLWAERHLHRTHTAPVGRCRGVQVRVSLLWWSLLL